MGSVSIAVQTDKTAGDYARLAARVEELGFDGMSVFSDLGYQPPLMALTAIAAATRRIRIGAACWNPFTTHPVEIAGQAAALDIASDGRGYVGLARGSWLDRVGISTADGLDRLADSAEIIRRLLAGDDTGYRGAVLGIEPGFGFAFPRRRPRMPLLFGVWGPKASAVAARYADEVKIGGSANPDMVGVMRQRLSAGAVAAGRTPDAVGVVAGAVTVVDRDRRAARRRARTEVAMYLDVVGALDPTVDLADELLTGVRSALRDGDADAAGALIPDDVLDRFAFAGAPDDVAAQAAGLFEAGAARVEFGTPHGLTDLGGVELLGTAVLPALAEWRS
ncbi:LLM class flavin-dependent oxidoreductase [Nakamurella deserti]|uniref:LLM class flavin-dependent oxidoreductase n=1 Tax=Nakamurella deserti TaxID=2164074 RepID=UPI00197B607A|nr:LLM class flavin-dependent oxidoreductase [Nakamurella deserti]